jgi:hypothetical protein
MNDNESTIAALQKRKAEILACEQDWMREDRAAQIDREIKALEAAPSENSE